MASRQLHADEAKRNRGPGIKGERSEEKSVAARWMVEQYLQHGRGVSVSSVGRSGAMAASTAAGRLPHDGNGHAVVQALKRNPDVQQMKLAAH